MQPCRQPRSMFRQEEKASRAHVATPQANAFLLMLCTLSLSLGVILFVLLCLRIAAIAALCDATDLPLDYWPSNVSTSHTTLAVFLQSTAQASIRYTADGSAPSTTSDVLSNDAPFLQPHTHPVLRGTALLLDTHSTNPNGKQAG